MPGFDAKLTKSAIPGEPYYCKRIIYYFCTHLRINFPATFCIDISASGEETGMSGELLSVTQFFMPEHRRRNRVPWCVMCKQSWQYLLAIRSTMLVCGSLSIMWRCWGC